MVQCDTPLNAHGDSLKPCILITIGPSLKTTSCFLERDAPY